MKRFVQIKNPTVRPQLCSIWMQGQLYSPFFLHTAVDQDRPVGSKDTFRPHIHDLYHLVLYTKGQGYYSFGGTYYPARPGTCVMISPSQQHEFITHRKNAVYSEVTFAYKNTQGQNLRQSFEQLLSLYSGIEIAFHKPIQMTTEAHLLQNHIIRLTDCLLSGKARSIYHASRCLAAIFDFLIEQSSHQTGSEIIDDRFQRVKMWIDEHYQQSVSADQLADMAGVSKGYFFRAFKTAFGISPLAYQQTLRIQAAKTLLHATSLSCNEIAARVGFDDIYFFYRIFKKHLQMTPGQFRKQI